MHDKPIVFLISGQVCSGKTSIAKLLEERTGAVRFTPDEWMLKLFPESVPCDKFDDIYYKCSELSWNMAGKCLSKGLSVILDFGLWKKSDREKYRRLLSDTGYQFYLIYVRCNDATIRERLRKRNENLPEGTFYISEEAYNYFSPGFEEPSTDENPVIFENNSEGSMKERFRAWAGAVNSPSTGNV